MPETILVPSRHALREMTFRNRAHANVINGSRVLWPNRFSTVTVSSAVESDATAILQALWIYAAANAENRRRLEVPKRRRFHSRNKPACRHGSM